MADPALHAREVAGLTALALVEGDLAEPLGHVAVGHEGRLRGRRTPPCSPCRSARPSRWARISSSAEDTRNGWTPMSTSRATVDGTVVGVQRGEDQVAGERGPDGDLRGLQVAGLTDQDDVGVLPQEGAQAPRRTSARRRR